MPGEKPDAELLVDSSPTDSVTPSRESANDSGPAEPPRKEAADDAPPASRGSDTPPDRADQDKGDDPLQSAIDRLTTKAEKPVAKKDAPPANADETPAKDEAPKAEAKPDELPDDPLDGYKDGEKQALKSKTRDRITHFHSLAKQAREQLKAIEPFAEDGKRFAGIIEKFGVADDIPMVNEDMLAGAIKAQAAASRIGRALQTGAEPSKADLAVVQKLYTATNAFAEKLGFAAKPAAAPSIEPLKGELPAAYAELVDVYGVPEEDARLLAAIRAAKAKPAAPAPVAAPAQPAPAQQAPAEQPQRQEPPQVDPRIAAEDDFYVSKATDRIVKDLGFKAPEDATGYFRDKVMPLILRTMSQQAFAALGPAAKYEATMDAHARLLEARQPAPKPRAKPPVVSSAGSRSVGRTPNLAAEGDDLVQSAINYLSGG